MSFDEYDDYDDYDDYEYDPFDHMTNDPIDFYTNGYGGFGYDTGHIKPDGKHSELFHAASSGDLGRVKQIVSSTEQRQQEQELQQLQQLQLSKNKKKKKKKKQEAITTLLDVINHAREWTEVDYRLSGFTKEYEWYDRTPLMIAIKNGHVDIVLFLLQQGADPTLAACVDEDCFTGAENEVANFINSNMEKKDFLNDMITVSLKYHPCTNHKNSRVSKRTFALPENLATMLKELEALEGKWNNKISSSKISNLAKLCRFYAKGECNRGSKCRFRHEMPREAKLCSFYAKGKCNRGSKCQFRHEMPRDSTPR